MPAARLADVRRLMGRMTARRSMGTVLVLAIDTSTPHVTAGVVEVKQPHELAAALVDAGGAGVRPVAVLAEQTRTDAFGHVEHLMPMIDAALAESGHEAAEVQAVVVGVGPGPFTGLRVGMVTAAAWGDARDVPVHGVPSHDAFAYRARGEAEQDGPFLVVGDARRKEVYVTAYSAAGAVLAGPAVLAPAAVTGWCAEQGVAPAWLTGAGASLAGEATGLPVREPRRPLSEGLVTRAAGALLTGAVPGPLVPLYLRRPDAAEPSAPKAVLGPAEVDTVAFGNTVAVGNTAAVGNTVAVGAAVGDGNAVADRNAAAGGDESAAAAARP